MWRMLKEPNSNLSDCRGDLESAINGENPMLTSFVPIKNAEVVAKTPSLCGNICARFCFALAFTAVMSPFIICDSYFALTDESCVHQSFDKLAITMYSYLLASAIFGIVIVSILNFAIMCIEFDKNSSNTGVSECAEICSRLFGWGLKLFGLSWSVVGFVIFWGYMDTNKCSKPVYNYLLAKFIIIIISIFVEVTKNRSKN